MQAREGRPADGVFLEDLCPKFRLRRWRQSLHELTAHTCIYCGNHSESIDHVHPKSQGGASVTENCVPACLACNGEKGDREAFDWYRAQSFYDPRRAMAIRSWTQGDLRLALKLLELVPAAVPKQAGRSHQTRQAASPLWRWQMAA
ncbi:MAG: HNH endonuclease signature motif containing protein [Cyanobacteriota bacterium]|nr:HNH endonuclease signature motif containing protein [Cyanobacteriota bacterium]